MEPVTTIDPTGERSSAAAGRFGARLVGAVVGAVAGLAAIAVLFVLSRLLGVADSTAFALLVGEDGVFSPTAGAPLAWLVPPIAAALVGAGTGPTAARGAEWSGAWMGFLTYLLGIVIGAVLLVLVPTGALTTAEGVSVGPINLLFGALVLAVVGGIIATPLLPLCVAGGVVWATVVRRVAPAAGDATPGSRPALLIVIVGLVLGVLWVLLTTFLEVLVTSQSS